MIRDLSSHLPAAALWTACGLAAAAAGVACVLLPPAAILAGLLGLVLLVSVLRRSAAAVAFLLIVATVQDAFFNVRLRWFDVTSPLFFGGADRFVPAVEVFFPLALVLSGWHLAARRTSSEGPPHAASGLGYPILLLLVYAAVGLLWSPNLNWTFVALARLLINALAFALILATVRDEAALRFVLVAYAAAGVVHCLMIIGSFMVSVPDGVRTHTFDLVGDWLRFTVLQKLGPFDPGGTMRPASIVAEYHWTGLILNTHLAAIAALLLTARRTVSRGLLVAASLLVLYTLLWTNVRAASIGLLGMIGFGLYALPGLRRRALVLVPALLLTMFVFMSVQSQVQGLIVGTAGVSRLVNTSGAERTKSGEVSESSVPSSRTAIWREAVRVVRESGGRGVGVQNFTLYTGETLGVFSCHPHSVYGQFVVDHGWVGGVVVLWAGVALAGLGLKVLRSADSRARTLALALAAGAVGAGIHVLVDLDYNFPILWCFLGLTCAALAIAGGGNPGARPAETPATAEPAGGAGKRGNRV